MHNNIDHKTCIRFAEEKDIILILQLIQEIVNPEKLEGNALATKEVLGKLLFSEKKCAEMIIAFHNEQPIGFALFSYGYSLALDRFAIYLEGIYLHDEAKELGVSQQLLTFLSRLAKTRRCGRLERGALEKNLPTIGLHHHTHTNSTDEWNVYRLAGEAFNKLAI